MTDLLAFYAATVAIALIVWLIIVCVAGDEWREAPYGTNRQRVAARRFLRFLAFGWVLALAWPLFLLWLFERMIIQALKDAAR